MLARHYSGRPRALLRKPGRSFTQAREGAGQGRGAKGKKGLPKWQERAQKGRNELQTGKSE